MKFSGPFGLSIALLITFLVSLQGCGTDPDLLPDPDSGALACPERPCTSGLVCEEGLCVEPGECEDPDGDLYGPGCEAGDDCDPDDPLVFPGAAELCNGKDDDCDGAVDEGGVCQPCTPNCTPGEDVCSGVQIVRCDDSSGCPSYVRPTNCPTGLGCFEGECIEICTDEDGDGFPVDCPGEVEDCDDSNPTVYPRAPELCDGLDNNCDGRIDEGGVCGPTCDVDCEIGTRVCTSDGSAYVECVSGGACPRWAAPRICGSSRSCAEGECVDVVQCVDVDGDGAGPGCDQSDCRPFDAAAHPGAAEVCNGVDDNCDGVIDDGDVCATCVEAPANAPLALTNNAINRVSCGGFEHFDLSGLSGDLVAVVLGGDARVALGTVAGGVFTPLGDQGPLGAGHAAYATVTGATVARVSASAGTRYSLSVAADSGACAADRFEPNGSPFAGTPLGTGPFALSATACASDLDFYEIDLSPGDVIDVAAAFNAGAGLDVAPQVWRNGVAVSLASGNFVDGAPQGRYTHFRADLPGTYAIGVRQRGAGSAYAAAIRTTAVACTDDAFETTGGLDDDTIETARALTGGEATGTLCPGDYDLIDLGEISTGRTLAFAFEVLSGDTTVDFSIIHDGLTSVAYVGNSDSALVEAETNISTSGRYYLLVAGRTSASTGTYRYTQSLR